MRAISVTPAGRKRYLEVLVPYLLRNRQHLSEHHFWLNTTNPEDIEYIEGLASKYPDFFKINRKEVFARRRWLCIWQYFQDYVDRDTIYLRLDDDICHIDDQAVANILAHRAHNTRPFLIYGNVVNNGLCSYLHQQARILDRRWSKLESDHDKRSWENGALAARIHGRFLSDVKKGRQRSWYVDDKTIHSFVQVHVNVVCWLGKDMQAVKELSQRDLRGVYAIDRTGENREILYEEPMISSFLPFRFGRPNEVCGHALFCHFAFTHQRSYLERSTGLLEEYRALASNNRSIPCTVGLKSLHVIRRMNFLSPLYHSKLKRELCRKIFPRTYSTFGRIRRAIWRKSGLLQSGRLT